MNLNELLDLAAADLTTRVTTLARLTSDELLDVVGECLLDDALADELAGLARLANRELADR